MRILNFITDALVLLIYFSVMIVFMILSAPFLIALPNKLLTAVMPPIEWFILLMRRFVLHWISPDTLYKLNEFTK